MAVFDFFGCQFQGLVANTRWSEEEMISQESVVSLLSGIKCKYIHWNRFLPAILTKKGCSAALFSFHSMVLFLRLAMAGLFYFRSTPSAYQKITEPFRGELTGRSV